LFVALVALAGCTRELSQPPLLVADDSQAVFDTVESAPSSTRVFTFTNTGSESTAPLTVQISGDRNAFHVAADECSGIDLAAGKRCSIRVELRSDEPGRFDGELHVAGAFVAASVVLSGKVTAAELVLTPMTSAEADVAQGDDATLELVVANLGGATTGPLHVTAPSSPFDVGGGCDGAPLVGGATCTITLHRGVAPDAAIGKLTGTLAVDATPGGSQQLTTTLNVGASGALYAPNLSWGAIPTLTATTHTIVVINPQLAPSAPLKVALTAGMSSQFVIAKDNCSGVALAPRQTCSVDLSITLYEAYAQQDTLTVSASNLKPAVAHLTASGVRAHWSLTIKSAGTGGGHLLQNGGVLPTPEGFLFRNGEKMEIELSAVADTGSTFAGWVGPPPCGGSTGTCTGIAGADNSDVILTAVFNK
jgi:hypothetical protein